MLGKIFNAAAMLLGAVGLAWMIYSIGPGVIFDHMHAVGWWAAAIFALDAAALCLDALALRAFAQGERAIPVWAAIGAQAGGRALNVLTPGGVLGEPLKINMLAKFSSKARVLSSIVLVNLSHAYISITAILIGTPICLLLVDMPAAMKTIVMVGVGVMIAVAVGLFVLVHRGAATTIVATLRRVRIIGEARATKWTKSMKDVDKHVQELHQHRKPSTRRGIALVVASHLLTWTATGILLATAGVHISPRLVVAVFSIGVLVQMFTSIVPMGLGLADGTNYGMYELFGSKGSAGVAITLLDRMRSIAIALAGLVAFGITGIFVKRARGNAPVTSGDRAPRSSLQPAVPS